MALLTQADRERAQVAAALRAAVDDPIAFTRTILGIDLWEAPRQILRALDRPYARVAVRACHSSGKTHLASTAVAWFMTKYPDSIVVTTAPTWNQVKNLLWKEISATATQSRIQYPKVNNTEWRWTKSHYAVGLSTTESEKFQGFHAPHVLIIIDEAPGVGDPIWEAIEGIEAGGDVRVLALGNPTISSGRFYQAFSTNKSGWTTFTIDAFDTPNIAPLGRNYEERLAALLRMEQENPEALLDNVRPYLTTRNWVVDRYHQWGTSSPLWTSRIRGRFPAQSSEALIALDWVEAARYRNPAVGGGHSLGVDVARYGSNDTAYCLLHGNKVWKWWKVSGRDTVTTAGEIKRLYAHDPGLSIVVDDSGVGGGVVDILVADNIPVIPFQAGGTVRTNQDMVNWGAETYWDLAESLKNGLVAFDQEIDPAVLDEATEQLVQIEYGFDGKQKIRVFKTGKDDKLPSPDYADSLNMAWLARRVEVNSAVQASAQIAPAGRPGESGWADHKGFWKGSGIGSALLGGGIDGASTLFIPPAPDLSLPAPSPYLDPAMSEPETRMICPKCGDLCTMRLLGRVENIRNYELRCIHCGHHQVVRNEIVRGIGTLAG